MGESAAIGQIYRKAGHNVPDSPGAFRSRGCIKHDTEIEAGRVRELRTDKQKLKVQIFERFLLFSKILMFASI